MAASLSAVAPGAAESLQAAVDCLARDGSDWVRGTAHHAREALDQTLVRLAPDSRFPPGQKGGVSQADRVRLIASPGGGKVRTWADDMAAAVVSTYRLLSEDAHAPKRDRRGLVNVIEAMCGLIDVLLAWGASEEHIDD